uniref:hypothetical protein n=1 Tax=Bidens pilosa TaxID=42337 RepID=UPI001FF3D11E|nr:hypothetical protein MZG22_mgp53 [Bidens pilosa]UIR99229.1 hypothetical protein [Bidens pilosa]
MFVQMRQGFSKFKISFFHGAKRAFVPFLLFIALMMLFYLLCLSIGGISLFFTVLSKVAGVKALSFLFSRIGCSSTLAHLFFFLGGTSLIMEMNSSDWGEYIRTSAEDTSTASADAGPVPHGNTVSDSTEGPASPVRFPYEPDELIGGDSVSSIQRRLLSSNPRPSAEEIGFARIEAEDLFEVKVKIIRRMEVLDPTGDWMRRGARALDSPNSTTGESSLERLYVFLEDLRQNGKTSDAFFSLSEKVALRRDDDAGSSA